MRRLIACAVHRVSCSCFRCSGSSHVESLPLPFREFCVFNFYLLLTSLDVAIFVFKKPPVTLQCISEKRMRAFSVIARNERKVLAKLVAPPNQHILIHGVQEAKKKSDEIDKSVFQQGVLVLIVVDVPVVQHHYRMLDDTPHKSVDLLASFSDYSNFGEFRFICTSYIRRWLCFYRRLFFYWSFDLRLFINSYRSFMKLKVRFSIFCSKDIRQIKF